MRPLEIALQIGSSYKSTGKLEIPSTFRLSVIALLEETLVDADAIPFFATRGLNEPLEDPESAIQLTPTQEQFILDRKWSLLSDEVIAGLVLSPTTLRRLQETICDEFPLAWLDQIDAGSDRILERYAKRFHRTTELRKIGGVSTETTASKVDARFSRKELSENRKAYTAFSHREDVDSHALPIIAGCRGRRHKKIIARLDDLMVQMRNTLDVDEFNKLDKRFHMTIGRAYFDDETGRTVSQHDFLRSMKFILAHGMDAGGNEARKAELKETVCAEHQAIVDALRIHDGDSAMKLALRHLTHSRIRWFPGLSDEFAIANGRHFKTLGAGDIQCVVSLNVTPVEMMVKHWDSTGKAAAAAIARGATLIYVRPNESLLKRWRMRLPELLFTELESQDILKEFRESVGRLTGMTSELVCRHVIQLHVDADRLFDLALTKSTVGYTRYSDGGEKFTRRKLLTEDEAWPEIVRTKLSETQRQHFFWLLGEALERYSGNPGTPEEIHSVDKANISQLLEYISQRSRAVESTMSD